VIVLRASRTLRLYCGGTFVKAYSVAVGKPGTETVLGEFSVRTKMRNPAWTDPETGSVVAFGTRENPLGTRWIGFTQGFGIHGTWEEETVGKNASHGCVRMLNRDVEELFDFLVRRESTVKIVDDLASDGKAEAGTSAAPDGKNPEESASEAGDGSR
jgi:lipoprotein-anchoring transpeptidase ErfK/SrfK